MLNAIGLYLKFAGMSIRGQMQYRTSFIMLTLGSFILTFIEFLAIAVLFTRFGTLKGWSLGEVAVCYGLVSICFGFSEAFGRGFDMFSYQVVSGEFDRTLLRPRSTGLQVLGHDFQLMRFGRLLQGAVVLIWASVNTGIAWDPAKLALLVFTIAGGITVFTGLLVLQAAMCFWSTQSLEVMNSFTYGGIEATQWPLPIYKRWFASFFIFIVPLACVTYYPMLALVGKPDVLGFPFWFCWISPLAGFIFLGLSLWVWQFGVRHYRSTGS